MIIKYGTDKRGGLLKNIPITVCTLNLRFFYLLLLPGSKEIFLKHWQHSHDCKALSKALQGRNCRKNMFQNERRKAND